MATKKPPCLAHGDEYCEVCYPGITLPGARRGRRPATLARRTLGRVSGLSVEDRVNIKTLAPILHKEEKEKYKIADDPYTEEELDYLIQNRL